MNKLTAEKCREQIEECRALKERGYLSINGEYKLQALEIALPVLEQQEKGDDGWIEWGGGKCPIDDHDDVEVKFRDGCIEDGLACHFIWGEHEGIDAEGDIIAYRVIENDGREG